jgi:hypothetical protein
VAFSVIFEKGILMKNFLNWAKAAIAYFVGIGIKIVIIIVQIVVYLYIVKKIINLIF